MTDYLKKEAAVIDDVVSVMSRLDDNLDKLDELEKDDKKHDIKKWYYEKKSIHDIKRILHDAKKYDKFDEKENEKIDEEFDTLINL